MLQRWMHRFLSLFGGGDSRRHRSEKADFISSNAMFYKILGREKKQGYKLKLKGKQKTKEE